MIGKRQNRDGSVTYTVRVHRGGSRYEWIGSFRSTNYPTKPAARRAAQAAESQALSAKTRTRMGVDAYAERFLEDYEGRTKRSSHDTARASLRAFRHDFGHRQLDSITRLEAKDWARDAKPSTVPIIVTLLNQAVEDELIDRNPFRGLGKRGKGRKGQRPPTMAEFEQLRQACSTLGKEYAPMMRAFLDFAGYTAARPGELFALEWTDVDFDRMRVKIARGLYRGHVDLPKSNEERLIAMLPPAADAIRSLPRTSRYIFTSKTGKRLSQPLLSGYWSQVTAKAGFDFAFYLSTRHFCAHYLLVTLGLPRAVVREQMGHADESLLDLYGHEDVGALERIDKAYEDAKVVPLRPGERTEGANGA